MPCCTRSNDAHGTENVDVVLVSEQYRDGDEENGWFADSSGRAAIVVRGNTAIDVIGPSEKEFRWLEIAGAHIYSCYFHHPRSRIFYSGWSQA